MALDLRPERYGSKAMAKGAEKTGAEILANVKPVKQTVQTSGRNPGGMVAVNDWVNRYNRVMEGVSKYDEKRNGGFTRDASGGYLGNINSLIADYENIRDVADQFGFQDSLKYLDQLKQLQNSIGEINENFSQFEDEDAYNRYMDYWKDQEEKRNLDLDAYSRDISALEQQLEDYDPQIDWTDTNQRKQYDAGLKELEDEINRRKQYLAQAQRIQKKDDFSAVANPESEKYDAAFDNKSGYVSTEQDGKLKRAMTQYSMGYGDLTYEYINNQNGIRDEIKHKASAYSKGETPFEEKGYDFMTEDEVGLYNYYYSMGGKKSAEAYLDTIQDDLNQRKAAGMYQQMEGKTGAEMVFGVEAGLDQFKSGIKGAVRAVKGDDSYVAPSATQYASGMVREDLADDGFKLPAWLGGASLGQVGYDAITTTANMAPSIIGSVASNFVIPGSGAIVGSALLGGSAGGNAYQEALNEGYTADQARGYGILSGASEIIMERLLGGISAYGGNALGKFFTQNMRNADTALKQIAKKVGGSMLSEFSEEYLQEVLTPVFQNLTLGTDNEVKLVSAEALYAGFLGAITGGIMEGPQAIANARNATEVPGNATVKESLTTELANSEDVEATAEESTVVGAENAITTAGATTGKDSLHVGQGTKTESTVTKSSGKNESSSVKVGVSKMETVQQTADIESFAQQFGTQADAVRRNYLEGQDLQEYELGFEAAYTMGRDGGKAESLNNSSLPGLKYLSQSQREIAFSLGRDAATAQNAVTATTEMPATSEAAQTAQISTGTPVEIARISNVDGNGGMTFELADGRTVNADDIQHTHSGEAVLYEAVADLGASAEASNKLVDAWKNDPTGVSAESYAAGMIDAFNYGRYNIPETEMAQNESIQHLSEGQRNTAYQLGKAYGNEITQSKESKIQNAGAVPKVQNDSGAVVRQTAASRSGGDSEAAPTRTGKVHFDRQGRTLSAVQETGLKTMEQLSQLFGTEFHVFESYEKDGKRVFRDENGVERDAPNGWYDPETGHIHIDLNAGSGGRGTMLFTVAHELTHFIRDWSPAKFDKLAEAVFELVYKEKNISVVELVRKQQAKAARNGMELTFDEAYEEVVADSMESILTSGNVVELMAEVKRQDQSLWQKIRKWFQDLAEDIRKMIDAYAGYKPDSAEGRAVAAMEEMLPVIEGFYMDALQEASTNYQAAEGQKNTTQEGGKKNSFAGRNAVTADHSALQQAKQLQEQGVDNETIRQRIGWFKGMDGKWRFEIDDSQMEISKEISNYMRLGDLMQHEKLFAAYPDLADIDVVFQSLDTGVNGSYHPQFDSINLSYRLKNDPIGLKDALVHEIQHAIQHREGFTNGATVASWERKKKAGFDSRRAEDIRKAQETERELRRIQEEEPEFYRDMVELDAMTPDLPRGEIDWETLEKIEDDPVEWQQYDARREELEAKYGDTKVWDMNDLLYQREQAAKNVGRSGVELYFDTAGEIEARDASNRRGKTPEQRKSSPPRLGNEDTVFAEGNAPADDYIPGDVAESELEIGINEVAEMSPISAISGTEFTTEGRTLLDDVDQFFKSVGGQVYNSRLGDINLTRRGVKDSLAHGMTPQKAAAFAAIPDVLRDGKVVGFEKNWKQRGYDSATIAAPITIGGEEYLMAVIVHRSNSANRFYVHDVFTAKKEATPFMTGTQNLGEPGGATSTISIIRKILDVKVKGSESGKKYSHRDTVYTEDDIPRLETKLTEAVRQRQDAQQHYEQLKNDSALVEAENRLTEIRNNGESRMAVLRTPEYKAARQRRDAIKNQLGIDHAMEEMYDLMDRERKLRKELDSATEYIRTEHARLAEEKAVAASGMSEADYFRDRAEQAFGTTKEFKFAGYLLPDGKMLDFTSKEGKQDGKRDKDHREISAIYEYTQQSAALLRFLNDGNIRVMAETPGVDISETHEPTAAQYAEIKRFVREYAGKRLFVVDVTGQNDTQIGTYTYDGRVNADRVVNDIKYYFQTGSMREPSKVASFRYSQRDPLQEKAIKALEKENSQLKEDVSRLRDLVKLQKKLTGGKMVKPSSVEAAARVLKKTADATGDTKELAKLLGEFYAYIANGEELTWEGVQEAAQEAADWLWNNRKQTTDEYSAEILRDLRTRGVSFNEDQKSEAAVTHDTFANYRKALFGSVKITENGMPLDEAWHELSTLYPGVFPEDTNSGDMPRVLVDIVARLRSSDGTYMGYDEIMARQSLIRDVYDSYWNVSTLYTVADVKQKEINTLKSRHAQRMSDLRTKHREKVEQLHLEQKAAVEAVRAAERQRSQERTRKALDKHRENQKQVAANRAERREKTEVRRKIRKAVMELNKLLNRGDKKKNVKDGMSEMVSKSLKLAEALFMDEYSNRDMLRNGVGIQMTDAEEILFREAQQLMESIESGAIIEGMEFDGEIDAMEQMKKLDSKLSGKMAKLKDVFARERKRLYGTTVSELLGQLADEYSRLSEAEDGAIRAAKDENVYAHLLQLQKDVGGTTVRDMTLNQLEQVADAYTMVLTTVRNANKMFAKNLKFKRDTLAGMVMGEIGAAAKKISKLVSPGKDAMDRFSWNNLKPVYAFERLGSQTLKTLFGNIRKGQDVWAVDMQEADAFRRDQYKKHKRKDWDMEKQYSFEFESGKVDLSLEQIMSLYAYSRREAALDHLLKGGFVFGGSTEVFVKKNGIKRRYLKKDATAYNLSATELMQVIDSLTKEQKTFVEEMQTYLSDVMGGKGNEVSMQMYGIKSFGEKNYFPLRSAGQYMEKAKEDSFRKEQGQISIVNSGFTKATTPHASNPITLDGFMDVWAEHVNDMAMYHGFVLPMEDFRRVYNYSTPNVEEGNSQSVNAAIENAFGKAATGYIDQLYKDLNGGALSDNRENLFRKLVSLHKKAAVFASASVVIQQPSAFVRAFALVDPRHFIGPKVNRQRHKQLWAELKQYAPVAFVKEMGYFDTGMGRSAKDFLQAEEYSGIREKMVALFTDADYRDEVLGKAPALADEYTWCMIWEAVKRETKVKNPGMDVKSNAFLQIAGERFAEVIDKTQVYDSVLSRSANMRSRAEYMNMLTSFMAEPTTSINMLEDALRKGDRKQIKRTVGAVYGSVLLNSLLVSLVYAARDDDEDETYWEKYLSSVAVEVLDGINPITYYPFLRDIWSIGQGYDVERADMSLITDFANAAKAVVSGMKAVQDADDDSRQDALGQLKDSLWGMTDSVANLTGVPVKNIRRDIEGARSMYQTIRKDLAGRKTTDLSLQDAVLADVMNAIPIGNLLYSKSKRDQLYGALVAGDATYVQRLRAGYDSDAAYHSAIKLALRDNDSRILEAAVAWNAGDMETYIRIAKEIRGENRFEQDDIVLAIRAEASSMAEKDGSSASTVKGYFTNEKFGVAMGQNNVSMADTIRKDLIDTAVANGKTREEAEESVRSTARTQLKQLYANGTITGANAEKMLVKYGGYDQKDAAGKVAEWKYEKDFPELDGRITYAQYKRWETDGKSRGIGLDTFTDVVEYRGGNTSAGVRSQEDVAAYINRMPISTAQKDALWCCFWSESTLYKNAPWH